MTLQKLLPVSLTTECDLVTVMPEHGVSQLQLTGAPLSPTINVIKGSPYSITERRVPGLIPVLGSQPAGDVNRKPDGRLPLLSARPAVRNP